MKSFIFFIFLILILTTQVSAVGFSPSSLTFNLKPGESECKMISINSESETITAEDKWAENKNVEWKVSEFDTDASSLGISIDYPNELSLDEREVQVCLSGENLGEYHGVLLLREEQQGNSIIQMGIWLKVIISNEPTQSSSTSSSSGGSSTNSGTAIQTLSDNTTKNTQQKQITNEENKSEIENSGITGGTIGVSIIKNKIIIIIFTTLLVIVAVFVFMKKKKERENFVNYGIR
ncbi:MAG: hypothetical protein WC584_02015 [Candidatus Pacearchaeota archaeon]